MPIPCKNPTYGYNKNVRLTFCHSKVVEAKKKWVVNKERTLKRKLHKGVNGGYYYIKKGKKYYVKEE